MKNLRKLWKDERGQSPWLVMASVALYSLIGATVATSLAVGITSANTTAHNAAVKRVLSEKVQQAAALGYYAYESIPVGKLTGTGPIDPATPTAVADIDVDGRTVPVSWTIHRTDLAVQITYVAGTAGGGGQKTAEDCAEDPAQCIISTETTFRPRTTP